MANLTPSYARGENIDPNTTPTISSGDGAPGTTPGKVGDIYVDTTGGVLYFAKGTSSSADWQNVSNGA